MKVNKGSVFLGLVAAGVLLTGASEARTKNIHSKQAQISVNKKQVSVRPKVSAYPGANKVYNFPKGGKSSAVRWR